MLRTANNSLQLLWVGLFWTLDARLGAQQPGMWSNPKLMSLYRAQKLAVAIALRIPCCTHACSNTSSILSCGACLRNSDMMLMCDELTKSLPYLLKPLLYINLERGQSEDAGIVLTKTVPCMQIAPECYFGQLHLGCAAPGLLFGWATGRLQWSRGKGSCWRVSLGQGGPPVAWSRSLRRDCYCSSDPAWAAEACTACELC